MAIAVLRMTAGAVTGALNALRMRTQEEILAAGAVMAEEMERTAKRDAPWTDRTGNARRTITGINTFDDDGDTQSIAIGVCGQMSYSPRLEQGFNHRYAVLVPTIRKYKDDLLDRVRNIISIQEGCRFG